MSYYRRKGRFGAKEDVKHGDDWLMTYADMITLLLCFFVIFLSVSVPKKTVEATLHLPQPPVTNPRPVDIFEGNLPFHGVPVSEFRTEALEEEEPKEEVLPEIEQLAVPAAKAEQAGGDRITTFEMDSAAFFDSGSASLSDAGKLILQTVTVTLNSAEYSDYQVTVEGHTDDSPINTLQFPSNWELSTARASAVVHYFLEQGILPQRLRAAGYADTFPKAPNRDAQGAPLPDNQAANRRVVIKLEKIEKEG